LDAAVTSTYVPKPHEGGADVAQEFLMVDPETVAALRRLLALPDPSGSIILEAINYADEAATAAWYNADGRSQAERMLLAIQAAADALIDLKAAMAEGDGQAG
jgi:hypothetical protein